MNPQGRIRYEGRDWSAVGSGYYGGKSNTKIMVSRFGDRLFVFEPGADGAYLDEANIVGEHAKTEKAQERRVERQMGKIKKNEFQLVTAYLEEREMAVNSGWLDVAYREGLTLEKAQDIYERNKLKYHTLIERLRHTMPEKVGFVVFNQFKGDWERLHEADVVPYAKVA